MESQNQIMNKTIFISAGEISGDIHAADLIKEISSINNNIKFVGLGGQNMLKTNFTPIDNDNSYMSTVGFTESLRFYNKKLKQLNNAISFLKSNKVDLVVLVDNQGFNIPLAKISHKLGIKTVYYFPPHVSIWGKWNTNVLAKICDLIIVPYYPDYLIYKDKSDKVFYSGSPLVDKINNFNFDPNFYNKYNINKNKKIVGLFPGSRFQEIENLLPTMLDAAKILYLNHNCEVIISLAHPIYKKKILDYINKKGLIDVVKIIENNSYSCIYASDVLIMSSGTAVYEASLFRKPVVVCYKVSLLTYLIGKFLVKTNYISIPNILINKEIYPELLQSRFNEKNIIKYTIDFLNMSKNQEQQYKYYFSEIIEKSGGPNVINNVAHKIITLL